MRAVYAVYLLLLADVNPQLPPQLAEKARQMGCSIPQPSENVIKGQFAERGKTAWALICRRGRETTLVVFRTSPELESAELGKTVDGDGIHLVGRHITAVDKKYILEHCQSADVRLPIDHDGILDGSVVHYYQQEKWLHLTLKPD